MPPTISRFGKGRWVLTLTVLAPCAVVAQETGASEAAVVVERFVDAFNAHDVAAMLALVTDDVELYYADERGGFDRSSSTANQLAGDMNDYFRAYPDVRSRVEGMVPGPVFVSFREQIVGGQSSLAVYEVRDGRIRRVWYFPAEDAAPGG